jgi:hypothetical protein
MMSHYSLAKLQPFQLALRPSMAQLQQQEGLSVTGRRGFRVQQDAFAALSGILMRLGRSKGARDASRAAQMPKTVSRVA